ncbi:MULTISPECIES: helix-turn-helix domain-containing protein [unclassified Novosphingobium]|uniref:helix-turn-helix domain-containing protein n=1 Tax=unclassified Novosphingobium TaxID=2644732 RepID=UPI00020EEA79|nr:MULTISPECIES: helix-turn-helix transcriptional regulator [unclassified Novosphingobium]GFM27389.1 XRE family transcriptional regulator [Novosphingobium sp. PY1]CCA91901.1 XRE family transcriptional regulator [Novosphingobium sp. PP1Y]
MAIAAQFDELPVDAARPRAHRRKLRLEARGALESGTETSVVIHNLSESGMLMESKTELEIGEAIDLDFPEAGQVHATVEWASGTLYGCSFDKALSAFALSAAQLRGAVEPGVEPDGSAKVQGVAAIGGETLGERLHRLRKLRGMTQGELAEKLGVSKPTVWAWEQDRARPIEDRIEPIAQALGVTASDLKPTRTIVGLPELIARCRSQIAEAVETTPEKIKIMIEL